ncbi:hypothetical protein [Aeromonas salmonicida]|uniref:Uncharacterized protein n=1 Tax=Aeromonas salmonicida subsp. pectinolytica 34mel TaxID=1324960 RepID=A0A2D1QI27_AERSA|nr:hypothetical protein [Aeromonas salmonicida]ATP09912.1 uncharacterized protein Asalp_27870 [Aeromonas salmonicida subsp. pectinolytica 34mel]
MLIIVNESIINAYSVNSVKFRSSLNNILNSHFNKKHFVYITPKVARTIKSLNTGEWSNFLSEETIIKIDQIANHCMLHGSINSSVSFHIHIYYDRIISPITDVDVGVDNASIWSFSILSDLEWILNPAFIYGENIDDSTLFEYIAKSTAMKRGLKNKNIKFRREMTGGCGNIKNVIKTRNKDAPDVKSPCFFIADSDYKFPRDEIHSIRKGSKTGLVNYNHSAPMSLYITKAREVENLIPIELLISALDDKSKTEISIANALVAIDLFYKNYPEHYKYIDIKEGTCLHKVNDHVTCRKFFRQTEEHTTTPCSDATHQSCFQLTPKLGDIVLSTLNDYINRKGERYLSTFTMAKNTDEWLQLEQILFSISLCNDSQLM